MNHRECPHTFSEKLLEFLIYGFYLLCLEDNIFLLYKVKAYLQRQWTRILSGRVSLQDFVFAKEVRLGTYSMRTSSSLPPAAIVATKAMRADPRAEPCYGERVPYVVIHGEPGARLVDMVVDPLDLLAIDSWYRLNDLYYINKQIIPALQRVFGLVGADLNSWFLEMPRPSREAFAKCPVYATNLQRSRIDFYYLSKHCILCGELVQASAHLCSKCSRKETTAATAIVGRTSKLEREMQHLASVSVLITYAYFAYEKSQLFLLISQNFLKKSLNYFADMPTLRRW